MKEHSIYSQSVAATRRAEAASNRVARTTSCPSAEIKTLIEAQEAAAGAITPWLLLVGPPSLRDPDNELSGRPDPKRRSPTEASPVRLITADIASSHLKSLGSGMFQVFFSHLFLLNRQWWRKLQFL